MKLFFVILFLSTFSHAGSLTCKGITNNSTIMPFEVEILMSPDSFVPNSTTYRSTIRYALPGGEKLQQSIDLDNKLRIRMNKVIFEGSTSHNYLELNFNTDGSVSNGILNQKLSGMDKIPVQCESDGDLPARRVCAENIDKNMALINAVRDSADIDLIETIIECGANVNQADKNGCTPAMFAIDSDCGQNIGSGYVNFKETQNILDSLLNNGAYINVSDKKGETPLMKAVRLNITNVYNSFIAAEAEFDAVDNNGNTALMIAAKNANRSTIQEFLEGNPDRAMKNKEGNTAFDIAKRLGRSDVLDLLLIPKYQVILEGQKDGSCSPLDINIAKGDIVEFVLKASEKMFLFKAPQIGIEIMADANSSAKRTFSADRAGEFKFTCGYHGSAQSFPGKITVK